MCKGLVNIARTAIIVLLLSLFAGSIANAVGTISITSITPSEATSNSLYAIKFTIAEEKGIHPDGDKLYLNIKKSDGKAACTPINIDGLAPSWTKDGNTYTVYMSAGLKMNINAEPASWDASTELWISPTGQRIVYTPALMAKASIDNDDAAAQTFAISLSATWTSGTPPVTTKVESGAAAVTIHDSHTNGYGGAYSDKDFLWGYTGYPEAIDSDPLTTLRCTGESPDDTENPDDGTSSTEFTFKVIYRNSDNLPPVQYLLKDDFRMFAPYISLREKINGKGVDDELTGVVLYIGMQGGEYYALPMQKANPADNDYRSGVTYQYVLKPEARNGYRALPNGVYKYFFADSDDTILDTNGRPYTWLEARPFAACEDDRCARRAALEDLAQEQRDRMAAVLDMRAINALIDYLKNVSVQCKCHSVFHATRVPQGGI
jgi:hypothetical protein